MKLCIQPLSIEAIVLAHYAGSFEEWRDQYPSSINRGYRSGTGRPASPTAQQSIHPLSIEAIVLAPCSLRPTIQRDIREVLPHWVKNRHKIGRIAAKSAQVGLLSPTSEHHRFGMAPYPLKKGPRHIRKSNRKLPPPFYHWQIRQSIPLRASPPAQCPTAMLATCRRRPSGLLLSSIPKLLL